VQGEGRVKTAEEGTTSKKLFIRKRHSGQGLERNAKGLPLPDVSGLGKTAGKKNQDNSEKIG